MRKSTGLPSPSVTIAPSSTHRAWSQPEEKLHRPVSRCPPGSACALPVGAYEDDIRAARSVPQTSSWACGGNSANCQACTPRTEATHPVDPQALAISRTALRNVTGSASRPSKPAGWSSRKNPVSSSALTDSAGTTRASSVSCARSRSTGSTSRTPATTVGPTPSLTGSLRSPGPRFGHRH